MNYNNCVKKTATIYCHTLESAIPPDRGFYQKSEATIIGNMLQKQGYQVEVSIPTGFNMERESKLLSEL